MNFLKHFLVLTAAVLVVFSGQSEAAIENPLLSSIAAPVGSGIFAKSLRMAMAEGEQYRHYYDTKTYIQRQSYRAADSEANTMLLNGFIEVIDFVKSSARSCYMGLREANNSVATSTPEAVIEVLERSFGAANMDIVNAGAKAYITLGGVNEITGEKTTHGLKEATEIVTRSGGVAFGGYTASKDLAAQGIRSGKDAPVQALLAAYRGVQSTEQAAYNMIKRIVQRAYEALLDRPLTPAVTIQDMEMKDSAAAQSPKCQNAIDSVEQSSLRASSQVATVSNKDNAIQVVRFGLLDALKTIALAGQSAYNAIDQARNIEDKEVALAVVNEGIADAINKCIKAVSVGQLALGAVPQIIGSQIEQPIIQAMIIIETSRVALLQGLQNSQVLLAQGIENDASEKALQAGADGVATSGFSAYAEISKSADFAFATVVSA